MGCMSVSFTWKTSLHTTADNRNVALVFPSFKDSAAVNNTDRASLIYQAALLEEAGLSKEAFLVAWKGFEHLLGNKKISNTQLLTICDFSQPSDKKRMYIIDVEHDELIRNTYVAHGRNSGNAMASRFSNKASSLQSSLGFYITGSTYTGKHGLSLRVDGLDRGFNDQAMERAIVIHGAAYIGEARAKAGKMMGRSWGCPAVPVNEVKEIISTIKNGTCLFIYHPQKDYLLGSKILND
jgi:hypothetical protein